MSDPRIARERAIDAEWIAVAEPHQARIRELGRLIAIEERHIERKRRVVALKRETVRFTIPASRPLTGSEPA